MLFFKENTALVVENARLKSQVENLEGQLKEINDEQRRLNNLDVASAKFAINFNVMKVFSIERNNENNNGPVTIIGHFVDKQINTSIEPVIHQWYLYCPLAEHQRLVDEFNAWRKANK